MKQAGLPHFPHVSSCFLSLSLWYWHRLEKYPHQFNTSWCLHVMWMKTIGIFIVSQIFWKFGWDLCYIWVLKQSSSSCWMNTAGPQNKDGEVSPSHRQWWVVYQVLKRGMITHNSFTMHMACVFRLENLWNCPLNPAVLQRLCSVQLLRL